MKNQQLVIILILAALLRNIFPFVDVYIVTLVVLLLLNQDTSSLVALFGSLVAFIYSLFFDTPIGLFPLIISLGLFIFGTLQPRITAKGIAPLLFWSLFTALTILADSMVRIVLTTGRVLVTPNVWTEVIGSVAILFVLSFLLSFKRKI